MRLRFAATVVALLAVLSCSGVVTAGNPVVTERYLGIPTYYQESYNWCWATSDVAVLSYYGVPVGRCEFVAYVKGKVYPVCPDEGGSLWDSSYGLVHWRLNSQEYAGTKSYATVRSQIDANQPLEVRWAYAGGGGHRVVLDGYYQVTIDGTISAQEVRYMDPAYGAYVLQSYSGFVNSSGRYWDGGLWTFSKF